MKNKQKILIFGSNGLVGSSCKKVLSSDDKFTVIPSTRQDANLFNFDETKNYIQSIDPDVIIIAAAKVGGIYANNTKELNF